MRKFLTDKEIENIFYKYEGLIHGVINKEFNFHNNNTIDIYSYDDLFSEGKIALLRTIGYYDEDKGFEESTFYYTCIKNHINTFMFKNVSRTKRIGNISSISLDTQLNDDVNINLIDTISKNDYLFDNMKKDMIVWDKIRTKKITSMDEEIIEMLIDGLSKKEIAKVFGLKQDTIQYRIDNIRKVFSDLKHTPAIIKSSIDCYVLLDIKKQEHYKFDDLYQAMEKMQINSTKELLKYKIKNHSLIDKRYILFKNMASLVEWRNS